MAKNYETQPIPKKERWYYKHKASGKAAYCLKEPLANILPEEELDNYEEIEKEEWETLTYVAPVEVPQPTEEELHQQEVRRQIAVLKGQLAATDYQCLKYAEGWLTEEEYAPIKAARQELRDQINELEGELE